MPPKSPIMTEAGHCYTMNESAIKVPYDVAVDMGTSVMWASFNLGAEDEQTVVDEHIAELRGSIVMWGANRDTGAYGSAAQTTTGYYWTASASTQNSTKAYSTIIVDKSARIHTTASRYTGLPVRPVFTK